MSNESPPGTFKKTPSGEFTWPPSREELDAIEVIPLDALPEKPIVVVPANRNVIVPVVERRPRRSWLPPVPRPRRDDVVMGGVFAASVLAIAIAASMQFTDLWSPAPERVAAQLVVPVPQVAEERTLTPLIAQAVPAMSSLATAPAATFASYTPAPPSISASRLAPRRAAAIRPRPAPPAAGYRPAERVKYAAANTANYTRPRLISPDGGRSGKLVLLVEVKKNGKVGDVDVLSSDLDRKNRSHRDLQRAAVSTVKRWRYEPAFRDGMATDTQIRVVVNIDLDSSRVGFTEANARRRAMAANRAADSVLAAR